MRSQPVEVKDAGRKGLGLFALQSFKKGEAVHSFKSGTLLTRAEIEKLSRIEKEYLDQIGDNAFEVIEPPARYVNHSCDPNVKERERTAYALRDIKAGEEITINYDEVAFLEEPPQVLLRISKVPENHPRQKERMIVLDGKRLSEKLLSRLKEEFSKLPKKLLLAVVTVSDDAATRSFLAQKKKIAAELGVDFRLYEHPASISTNELRTRVATIVHDAEPDSVIIQLPLPEGINAQYILNGVPPEKDVDVLSARAVGDFAVGKSRALPPVVGAIKALFDEYGIEYQKKHILVIGAGRLVGKPVALWLLEEKVSFTIVDERTLDVSEFTKKADIIIAGAGKPGLVTGDMVKEGVVVIDAGTSESAGKLVGDVDFDSVSKKASFITPVPGGVGPVTVAMIFRNLLVLTKK